MLGFRTQPWHRPTSTYYGRTPMQARGSLLFLHLVYCVYASVCMYACSSDGRAQTHTLKPPCTHPLSRQDLLVGPFFVSRAIQLLASEASFILYPYHHRFAREFVFFEFFFSGTDWLMIGHV